MLPSFIDSCIEETWLLRLIKMLTWFLRMLQCSNLAHFIKWNVLNSWFFMLSKEMWLEYLHFQILLTNLLAFLGKNSFKSYIAVTWNYSFYEKEKSLFIISRMMPDWQSWLLSNIFQYFNALNTEIQFWNLTKVDINENIPSF